MKWSNVRLWDFPQASNSRFDFCFRDSDLALSPGLEKVKSFEVGGRILFHSSSWYRVRGSLSSFISCALSSGISMFAEVISMKEMMPWRMSRSESSCCLHLLSSNASRESMISKSKLCSKVLFTSRPNVPFEVEAQLLFFFLPIC